MNQAPQPTRGSLEATIIRACPTHEHCELTCPERKVEVLGQIAYFDTRSMIQRVREALRKR